MIQEYYIQFGLLVLPCSGHSCIEVSIHINTPDDNIFSYGILLMIMKLIAHWNS
jgi:hypothetical protein